MPLRTLSVDTLIGIAAVLITLVGGFATVARLLYRIELKVDIMWRWFAEAGPHRERAGRRTYDLPIGNGDE